MSRLLEAIVSAVAIAAVLAFVYFADAFADGGDAAGECYDDSGFGC